jgi:Zn-finger nucleic acid-binding protein
MIAVDGEIFLDGKCIKVYEDRTVQCSDSRLLSTNFGNSKIVIDRCSLCHGVWLEGGEFNEIVRYLREELNHLTSQEMEKKVVEAVKRIWSDSSESKISEILDAKAAISALICISIYERPPVAEALIKAGVAGKTVVG